MTSYRLSNEAKDDLLRIHEFGTVVFGSDQADKYLNNFFDCFDLIAKQPMAFQSVDHIKKGYKRCVCGVESIFYRIENDVVEIITIIGRQDINQIFNNKLI